MIPLVEEAGKTLSSSFVGVRHQVTKLSDRGVGDCIQIGGVLHHFLQHLEPDPLTVGKLCVFLRLDALLQQVVHIGVSLLSLVQQVSYGGLEQHLPGWTH